MWHVCEITSLGEYVLHLSALYALPRSSEGSLEIFFTHYFITFFINL